MVVKIMMMMINLVPSSVLASQMNLMLMLPRPTWPREILDDNNTIGAKEEEGEDKKVFLQCGGGVVVKILFCSVVVGRSPLKPRSTVGELKQFDSPCPECPKFTGASKTERMAHLRASHQVGFFAKKILYSFCLHRNTTRDC